MNSRKFLTGAEIVVQACRDAGAEMMYGYPITPATEILSGWIKSGGRALQTEDEIAAGFAVCGGVMAGQKAFTATSGPGHILMQDGLSMAEGMRLPFVMIIGQRGGPSSGTVIYSQQEVTLACLGGNGEGLRLVYSPASLSELYKLTRQAFNNAWQYRFPAIVLTDGYMLKSRGVVELPPLTKGGNEGGYENTPAYSLVPEGKNIHWRNIYTFEEELFEEVQKAKKDFDATAEKIADSEAYLADDAEIVLVAHGIVAGVAREAVQELRKKGKKVGMFRPITLRPFDKDGLNAVLGKKTVKKVVVIESSLGQLARLVKERVADNICLPFEYMQYPGLGIETEDIIKFIK